MSSVNYAVFFFILLINSNLVSTAELLSALSLNNKTFLDVCAPKMVHIEPQAGGTFQYTTWDDLLNLENIAFGHYLFSDILCLRDDLVCQIVGPNKMITDCRLRPDVANVSFALKNREVLMFLIEFNKSETYDLMIFAETVGISLILPRPGGAKRDISTSKPFHPVCNITEVCGPLLPTGVGKLFVDGVTETTHVNENKNVFILDPTKLKIGDIFDLWLLHVKCTLDAIPGAMSSFAYSVINWCTINMAKPTAAGIEWCLIKLMKFAIWAFGHAAAYFQKIKEEAEKEV